MPKENQKIVFFDGVCNLCQGSVQFLLKHNSSSTLHFSALGSKTFQDLFLDTHSLPDSIVYWRDGHVFVESDAILELTKELSFPFSWLSMGRIIPKGFRDRLYRWIAHHRKDWFGTTACLLPKPEWSHRFLD